MNVEANAPEGATEYREISEEARKELELILLLLVTDVRKHRDDAQRELGGVHFPWHMMLFNSGEIKACRDVLRVINALAELYHIEL